MKEWNNPYNSFNSWKVLYWKDQLNAIVNQEFLPPVIADTDPANVCNYNCIWCNAYDYMQQQRHMISEDHLIRLADFYSEWGIKSSCVAGGGEPLTNPGTKKFLKALKERGIEIGLITNGYLIDDECVEIIAECCKWVGFSMDAGTSTTYNTVKGISISGAFDRVISNIQKVCNRIRDTNSSCEPCYKYLLHPLNAHEIYSAAVLAKRIGVNDFQMRPVGWDNISKTYGKTIDDFGPLLNSVDEQVEKSLLLEDGSFHFYGIRHKFQPNMKRKVDFHRCWTLPLILVFGADGNCHLCFDRRGDKNLILCSHFPDPHEVLKHWGSKRHKEILKNIDVTKCPRCTYGPYNEIIEQVFLQDKMCRNFP